MSQASNPGTGILPTRPRTTRPWGGPGTPQVADASPSSPCEMQETPENVGARPSPCHISWEPMFHASPAVPWFWNRSSLTFSLLLARRLWTPTPLCLVSRRDCACLGPQPSQQHLLDQQYMVAVKGMPGRLAPWWLTDRLTRAQERYADASALLRYKFQGS
ncbi:hypothetical protein LX32DRAFT_6440 [Colletotrichum zoysiae]|uniref:Uncharacterized protein n=1 Tax=Colletotrichum zoysiae TaxID=1216348 RepID=A0AAD9M6T9_9PEZI|nr:hypothetical protein LX32DRAFT_6440 [Colletotrichum zoysiae]